MFQPQPRRTSPDCHSRPSCALHTGTSRSGFALVFVDVAVLAVCVSVLEQVHESMAPADRKNKDKIEAAIDAFCGQRLASRDDKMVSPQQYIQNLAPATAAAANRQ